MKVISDDEGTSFWRCSACQRPCDPYTEPTPPVMGNPGKKRIAEMVTRLQGKERSVVGSIPLSAKDVSDIMWLLGYAQVLDDAIDKMMKKI